MGLHTPSLITFLISFVLMLAVVFAKYFGAAVPGLGTEGAQFAGILGAYIVLTLGVLLRPL